MLRNKPNIELSKSTYFIPVSEKELNVIRDYYGVYLTRRKLDSAKLHFIKNIGIHPDFIQMLGDTSLNAMTANSIIDHVQFPHGKSYKCVCNKNWNILRPGFTILHEDGLSSWKCLLSTLGNPKFGIIIHKSAVALEDLERLDKISSREASPLL